MRPGPRILIVEDDTAVRAGIAAALRAVGYEACPEPNGDAIRETLDAFRPDLLLVDVALDGGTDGYAVAQVARAHSGVPVIFVTAADAVHDRLRGFDVGAEDYIVKPFAMAELLARIRVVLRRANRTQSPTFELRDVLVDERSRTARRSGHDLDLTHTEFDLLTALARNADQVMSKRQLLSLVWGFEGYEPNLMEVHISALRRKLERYGPRLIHTERGSGYVLRP
jgi:DNA-binding response OmpR family regulator